MESFVPHQQDETDPASTFQHLLARCGLEAVRCETRCREYEFDNANAAVDAVRAVNPWINRLDAEDTIEGKQMQVYKDPFTLRNISATY